MNTQKSQKTTKTQTNEAVDRVMNISRDSMGKDSNSDYIKILLLLEMYKSGDEVILEDLLGTKGFSPKSLVKNETQNGMNGVLSELLNSEDELEAFFTLSRCGRLARQACDYILDYVLYQIESNNEELFYADPDSSYKNDGYTLKVRTNYRRIISVYLNMLNAKIIKQQLLISELRGEELDPIRAKEFVMPNIESTFPQLFRDE